MFRIGDYSCKPGATGSICAGHGDRGEKGLELPGMRDLLRIEARCRSVR
jgi:hypothetical protein